jgi:hypothetical protein
MTTEALTLIVVDILGKFVVDHGATLLKEAGQAAAQAASQLYELVLTQLKSDPAEARNAERFEQNPEGYQAPIADAIAEKLGSDPNFSAQLSVLIEEYKKAASSVETARIDVGSGAVATQGGIAAGAGGVAIGGNVKGEVSIKNTRNRYSSGGTGP